MNLKGDSKVKILVFIFNGASLVVDAAGWFFSKIISFLIQGITSLCSWGINEIQSLPENIQIPIGATLAIIFIGGLLYCLWLFPQIIIGILIVVPLVILILKLLIGWIVLFTLIYAFLLITKRVYISLMNYVSLHKV